MEIIAIRPDPIAILAEREMRSLVEMQIVQGEIERAKKQFGEWASIPNRQRTLWATRLRHNGWTHDPRAGWFMVNNSVTLSSL